MEDKKDLYIINKLIMASSAKEALEKEKSANVTEVYIDAEWRKHKIERVMSSKRDIGF